MFDVFLGEHDNKLDGKGRLSIPADFRRLLEKGDPDWRPVSGDEKPVFASMVIVHGDQRRNYLEVFTIKDIMNVHRQIAQLPRGSRKRHAMQRLYAHQVLKITLDDTGRIVMPKKLRDKLGLRDKILMVGNGETFMIWHPDTYASDEMQGLSEDDDFDPDLDPSAYLPGSLGAGL